MNPSPSPLRWAVAQAEERFRIFSLQENQSGLAEYNGQLAKAHQACDEAEELRARFDTLSNEHMALRLILGNLVKAADRETLIAGQHKRSEGQALIANARQILSNLKTQ